MSRRLSLKVDVRRSVSETRKAGSREKDQGNGIHAGVNVIQQEILLLKIVLNYSEVAESIDRSRKVRNGKRCIIQL